MFSFNATIRIRKNGISPASWWFITIPKVMSDNIRKEIAWQPRKWRWSIPVEVIIGYYKRSTSIFPDKKSGSYLIPIKAIVRKELNIKEWSEIHISLTLIV